MREGYRDLQEFCWHHCFMSLITRFEFSGVIFPSQALSPRWIPQKVGKSLLCLFNSTVERSVCALHERQERVRDERSERQKEKTRKRWCFICFTCSWDVRALRQTGSNCSISHIYTSATLFILWHVVLTFIRVRGRVVSVSRGLTKDFFLPTIAVRLLIRARLIVGLL